MIGQSSQVERLANFFAAGNRNYCCFPGHLISPAEGDTCLNVSNNA